MEPHDFRTVRRSRRLHAGLQLLLVAVLLFGVNYLSSRWPWRADLTRSGVYTLSPEAHAVLGALERPIQVVVTLVEDEEDEAVSQALRDVRGLLDACVHASRGAPAGPLRVEYVDVFRERQKADLLGVREKNEVVFRGGEQVRRVMLNELYEVRRIGEGALRKSAFLGERVLVSQIREVSGAVRRAVYFLSGHGEPGLRDTDPLGGLSQLSEQLEYRGFSLAELPLGRERRIPDDAAAVVLAGPAQPLLPEEQEVLRRYLLGRPGRLLALLGPGEGRGLEELFRDWGVRAEDALVLDADRSARLEGGDLLLWRFAPEHPVTQSLAQARLPARFGLTRPILPDASREGDASLTIAPLVVTSASAWAESRYLGAEEFAWEPGDRQGPFPVGLAVERRAAIRAGVDLPGGRLVVIGSSGVVTNQRLGGPGNLTLFLGALNWAIGRETELNIAPREVRYTQFTVSETDLRRMRLWVLLGVPGALAAWGTLIFFLRRR